ncbi:L-gulonate 5-dehydrogenase [Raoultella sp. BIGb0399]|uniref:Zn-dependent oxidoreductase n=1 Tax=Raoultella sp. BIGb0399 TaxID=2485119 RepID=UPI000F4C1302|nr:Zn-dependent oxidoreductase [Raoultella sp. BIGb0399]ROS11137.1 L-gulonate 5-dehydrogenase [Raoultella sp. BIGb0399]
MKSIVIQQPNQLDIEHRPLPQPSENEVRVAVRNASICGSDVHIWHGHNPFAKYPRVIGHEFAGIIDAVGEGVAASRIGERVAIDPVVNCGECYPCKVGKPNVCKSLSVIGVHRDGGFSEYACVPQKSAWKLPDTISDEYASLIEPFTIGANICSKMQPTELDIALIYGAGPMGLTSTQVLKHVYNVKKVIVVDRVPERLKLALINGADQVIDNSKISLKEQLTDEPTLIIDAACHPDILTEAIALISPAGRIGLLGFSDVAGTLVQKDITSKELTIFTSRLNSNKFPVVMSWIASGLIYPEKLVTHHFPLDDIRNAMTLFEEDPHSCCKIIISIK